MDAKHTPGPWELVTGNHIAVFPKGSDNRVCMIYSGDGHVKETNGNALLIAAAPELLEACRQAVFAIPTTHGAFETVRAAIAKAEGR